MTSINGVSSKGSFPCFDPRRLYSDQTDATAKLDIILRRDAAVDSPAPRMARCSICR